MTQKRLSRQERQMQTRERLLGVAAEVFSQRGFHATSVEVIAEKAGFSKGAIYSNFTSKEELFLTLLDRHLEGELQTISAQVLQGEQLSNVEEGSQPHSFPAYLEEKRTWNLLAIEFMLYALRHPAVQQQLAVRYRKARTQLTQLVQRRLQVEEARGTFPPEYIVWALLALGAGLALQEYLEPGSMPGDLYTTIVARLLGSDAPRQPEK